MLGLDPCLLKPKPSVLWTPSMEHDTAQVCAPLDETAVKGMIKTKALLRGSERARCSLRQQHKNLNFIVYTYMPGLHPLQTLNLNKVLSPSTLKFKVEEDGWPPRTRGIAPTLGQC